MQCIGIHYYAMETNPRPGSGPGKGTKRARGALPTLPETNQTSGGENHVQVRCRGAELEPPVRTPHTVYVKPVAKRVFSHLRCPKLEGAR